MSAVLDTHAVIWYLLDSHQLSAAAYSLIDEATAKGVPTYVSAISLVEIVYLVERGRISPDAFEKFVKELDRENPAFTVAPVDLQVTKVLRQIPRSSVPDMPDRIIAVTALHLGLPIVTRDRRLQSTGVQTIW
jgi:PIN domain nuclease of toxin-antitoxin system